MKIEQVVREFHFNGLVLPDINPTAEPDNVRVIYSATYAELVTATVEGPEFRNGRCIYHFKRSVGTKG